jgi:DNA primase
MIDVDQIKQNIDCRALIEHDLGKPKYRTRNYSTYKCPLHNEQKGYSLVVYPDRWQCFGKCSQGGDVISWLMEYHKLSFQEACKHLSSGELLQLERPHRSWQPKILPLSEPPDAEWRTRADGIVKQARENLWSEQGLRALEYLKQARGLTEKIILDAKLGYIPGHYREWRTIGGLTVPCGITIPWYADQMLWGIKVRRATGQQRYQQVSGGNIKGCLYLADTIKPGIPLMLTEGEFDALIVRQVANELVSVASIGSATNKRINSRWFPKFITVPSILVRMDEDNAGQGAVAQISNLSQAVTCIQVPQGKDVNEFYFIAGHATVTIWINTIIDNDIMK